MVTFDDVKTLLAEADTHTLTITLDVDPALPENQATTPAWRIWLKNALKEINGNLNNGDKKTWEDIKERVTAFFDDYTPRSKGCVLFFGKTMEHIHELPISFQNRAVFGAPLIAPLLWAIDEFEHYLVVMVDQQKAHFLTAYLGGAGTEESVTLELDAGDWRDYTLIPSTSAPSHGGAHGTTQQGSHRDQVQDYVDEQIGRFHREVAAQAQKLAKTGKDKIGRIILSGDEQAAHAVKNLLPDNLRQQVIAIKPLPMRYTPNEIMERLLPVALNYERDHETRTVKEVIGLAKSGGRGAVGRDSVLEALDQNRVEVLFVPWPLEDKDLRARLSVQAFQAGSMVEMVRGEAADLLNNEGGFAARLYYAV